MKLTIKRGQVTLDIDVSLDEKIEEIQKTIYKSIPIAPSRQSLSMVVSGAIVRIK